MNRRKKKPAQVISIVLSFLMFGMMGLTQLTGSLGNNNTPSIQSTPQSNATPFPTIVTSRLEARLVLDQRTSFRLEAGEIIAVHYQGEAEEVITLRLTSEEGIGAQITAAVSIDGQANTVLEVVPPIGAVTEICGLILAYQADYSFTFKAPITGNYQLQLESGTTCGSE